MRKVKSGVIKRWADLTWRPLASAFRNRYKPWFSSVGRFLPLSARTFYPNGSAVSSFEQVQDAVFEFNGKISDDDFRARKWVVR